MRAQWEDLEPASRERVARHRDAVRRLESFTDTVFALSLVAVVVRAGLSLPDGLLSQTALRNALLRAIPGLYAHAACVLFLLVYWVLHHYQFRYLSRSSGGLVWLTGLLIAFVLLFPFTASLFSACGVLGTPLLLFEANTLTIQLLLTLTWRYTVKRGLMFGGDVPSGVVRRMRVALKLGAVYMVLVMGLAFVSPYVSLGLLLGLALFYVLLTARGGYTLDILHHTPPSEE